VLPLWNAWSFLSLYANAGAVAGSIRTDSSDVLDRYILAKTAELVGDVTAAMDVYDLAGGCQAVRVYLDGLTNWYIRRSRQRFWEGDRDAIDTLHTVLETVCRVAAPLLPLTTEVIFRGLTGDRSVHLTDWPGMDELPPDADLVAAMDEVREVASVALSVRKAGKLRVRQPLASMTVAVHDAAALAPFAALLADEVNVRTVDVTELAEHDERVTRRLTVNARAAGPRLGKQVQQVIKAAKAGDWSVADDGTVTCGDVVLAEGEYMLELSAAGTSSDAVGLLGSGGFVALDTALDDDLIADGLVRDVARGVQDLRKSAGLDVSDRIELRVETDEPVATQAISDRRDWLSDQVLAVTFDSGRPDEPLSDFGSTADHESRTASADLSGGWSHVDLVVGTGVNAKVRAHVRKS
jgi:isoleucyl-tRNA synthetase